MNSSNPLNAAAALMVMAFSPIALMLGIAGSLSDTGPMRPIFMLMTAAGLMMLLGGVQMLVKWRRAVRHEREHQDAIRAAVGQPAMPRHRPPPLPGMEPVAPAAAQPLHASAAPAASGAGGAAPLVMERPAEVSAPAGQPPVLPSGEPVLVHWTYAADEWSAYTRAEWKHRVWEAAGMGIGIFLLGWLVTRWQMGPASVVGAGMFGLIIFVGKLMMASEARKSNAAGPGEAIVTPTAVMLNGSYHVLSNDDYRFEGVRHVTTARPPVLEFKISWRTRGGRTHNEVRIPVPAGREAEAQAVVEALQRR